MVSSSRNLLRVAVTGLVLCGIALLLLAATSPIDRPLWVGVNQHVPDQTLLAWAIAGLVGFVAYLVRGKLSNATKWVLLIFAIVIASYPTGWLLMAVIGIGDWLPPFGSYLWARLVNPVIAEMVIGIMIALFGALAVSNETRRTVNVR